MSSGGSPKSLYQDVMSQSDPDRDRYAGARVLWLKVIIRAAFDWVAYRDSDRFSQKKIADNAFLWLFSSNHLFNSFESICMSLDILPEGVRDWARSLSKEDIEKIEHLDREGKTSTPKAFCMIDTNQK